MPRYRPHIVIAESQLTQDGLQARANWLRAAAYGNALSLDVTLAGFRQPDGSLWKVNQLVTVSSPLLGIDADLLVADVEFAQDSASGSVTALMLAPIEAYTPDPGSVKLRKHKGHGGGAAGWDGVFAE